MLDGDVLDGRNRYRACAEAGIAPRFEEFVGADPLAFVLSMNVRGMIAAGLANLGQGGNGSNQYGSKPANLPICSDPDTSLLPDVDSAIPDLFPAVSSPRDETVVSAKAPASNDNERSRQQLCGLASD